MTALTSDGVPSPSAYDPGRNRHRCGIAWAWTAVAAILANPRYTGRQVWNKQRKDEILLDVDDVALGNVTKLRWNEPGKWIWSDQAVHEPLVDVETFERAQTVRRARGAADERSPRRTARPYALRGVVRCGACGRRMQGSWNNGAAYYRCVFLNQYAAKNKISHPRSVYLREDQILPRLDDWLTTKFSPGRLPATVRELVDAQDHTGAPADAGTEAAKQEIADCDASLRPHRAALEAGASPEIVTSWINETQAKRAAAEARLRQRPAGRRRMTREEITNMAKALGDLMTVLSEADPADKAEVYGQLGLTLTYDPARKRVKAEARPESIMYVGTCPRTDCTKKPMRPDL